MQISQEGLDKLQEALGLENSDPVFVFKSDTYMLWIRATSVSQAWAGIVIVRALPGNRFECSLTPAAWCLPGTERPPHPYPDLGEIWEKIQERFAGDKSFLEHVTLSRSA